MKDKTHSLPSTSILNYFNLVSLGAAILLLLIAPSTDSFWIDEANSANMAMQHDLRSWWGAVNQVASDVQMSPYFFQLWVWEKVVSSSELGMRCNNLPWILLGIGAWFLALPRSTKGAFVLLAGVAPFLWYYANEIRPYSMLFGASSLMFASLFACAYCGLTKARFLGFGLGALLAIEASAAVLPWVGIAVLFFIWLLVRADRSYLGMGLLLAIPALALAGLYLWSFSHGAHATSPEPSSLGSLLFVPYELLGFTGLGPGRMEMRSGGIGTLKHYLPQLGVLFVCFLVVIGAAIARSKKELGTGRVAFLAVACLVPVIAVTGLGLLSGLRTTGRHFTPALALILPLVAVGVQTLWKNRFFGKAAVVCLFAALAVSSFQIRLASRHKKDNYREAARIARQALESGQKVWWAADPFGASYYGVSVGETPSNGSSSGTGSSSQKTAQLIRNLEKPGLETPDVLVLNRPDVYDSTGVVAKMLSENHYQLKESLQCFTIWEKPPTP